MNSPSPNPVKPLIWSVDQWGVASTDNVYFKDSEIGLEVWLWFRLQHDRLVLTVNRYRHGELEASREHELGRFPDRHGRITNLNRYCRYVLDGFAETWTLHHCPRIEVSI